MGDFSSGAQRDLFYKKEAIYGVTPDTTGAVIKTSGFAEIRNTEDSVSLVRDSFVSDERRGDRGIHDHRLGTKQPAGDIGFEFSHTSFDDFLAAALCSDLVAATVPVTTTNMSAYIDATTGIVTAAAEAFITDGYEVGDTITMADWGDAGNNGTFVISALPDETHMTVYPTTNLVTVLIGDAEADIDLAAFSTGWNANVIKKGTQVTSFSMVKSFSDILRYQLFTGGVINTMSLDVNPNAMVTGSFGFLFKDMSSGAGAYVTSPSATGVTHPFDGFTGSITEGGGAISVVSSLSLSLDNGFERNFALMSSTNPQVTSGKSNITGTVTLYFEDATEYDKFINETESALVITLEDLDGATIAINLPRIKYTSADSPVNSDGATMVTMNFQALDDSSAVSNIVITRSA